MNAETTGYVSLFCDGLNESHAERRSRLETLEDEIADAGRVDILGPLIAAENVAAAWDVLTVARQRAIVDMLATVILHPPGRGTRTFRPETVEIEWKADR